MDRRSSAIGTCSAAAFLCLVASASQSQTSSFQAQSYGACSPVFIGVQGPSTGNIACTIINVVNNILGEKAPMAGGNITIDTKIKRESTAKLALELANLDGMERGLIKSLEIFTSNSSFARFYNPSDADQITGMLNSQVDGIRGAFMGIRDTISKIDPAWAQQNLGLVADIGAFAHDGILFYVTPSRRLPLANPDVLNDLMTRLREEERQIMDAATRLSDHLTRGYSVPLRVDSQP